MSLIKESLAQLKRGAARYLIVYALLWAGLLAFSTIAQQFGLSVAYFTRDPAITLYGHPFVGALSHVGILFWCASVAICLFAAVIFLRQGDKRFARFLLVSALFTLLLMLDDLFMFHEFVFPFSLGIPQTAILVTYVVLALLYFVSFGRLILTLEYMPLLLACAFFALSLATDIFMAQDHFQFMVEDGAKLFGIVTWLMFFARCSYARLMALLEQGQSS